MASDHGDETVGLLNIDSANECVDATDGLEDDSASKINLIEAFFIMFGFTLGTGILIISDTIRQLGVVAWIFCFTAVITIQCLCSYMLYMCTRIAMDDQKGDVIRDPYQAVAEISGGFILRKFSIVMMYAWNMMCCLSVLLVAVSMVATFIPIDSLSDANNMRVWVTLLIVVITPIMYLGTYSDLKLPTLIAVGTSSISGVLVLINCLLKRYLYPESTTLTHHKLQHADQSFFISIGSLIFMTGAALTVPNVTVLASKPEKLTRSILSCYATVYVVFVVVGLTTYYMFDGEVASSIITTFKAVIKNNQGAAEFRALTMTIEILMLIHLVMVAILSLNPLYLHLEEVLKLPRECNCKRVLVRTACMLFILAVCLLIPQFQFAVGIAGGVPFTIMGIFLPAFMYVRMYEVNVYSKVLIYVFLIMVVVFILGNLIVSVKNLMT